MTSILFYSTYSSWSYHSVLETTWGHALRARGADVRFALCNAVSPACDVYRENLNPRQSNSCNECQAATANVFARMAMPYDWLGTYLPLGMREKAEEWAGNLAPDRLLESHWRDMPVGQWAATSAYNQFRTAKLCMDDPKVVRVVRDLLVGTVVNLEALDVMLDTHRPDTLVLLNGRFFGHWTAIELAKRKGIRYVTHERGFTSDTVRFAENARTHDLTPMHDLWNVWRDVPLDPAEAADAAQLLLDRRAGKNFSRLSFSPPLQEKAQIKAVLKLDDRPIVAVFTSSDDETVAFPERTRGAFPISNDFLPEVIRLAQTRPHVQFVVRIHPNISIAKAGTNQDAMQHAEDIRRRAPANVHVVMPDDDVSSYTLMDLAAVGMVYGSTIGLEMAACGKPVLCMAQATFSHTKATVQIDSPVELGPALDHALGQGISLETARVAMRWVYRYFREFSIPFDLIHEPATDTDPTLRFSSVSDLVPGRYESLDRICSFLEGSSDSVVPRATEGERQRQLTPESQALTLWLQLINGEQQYTAAV